MATLTAGTSIKDGFLPGIDEPAEAWADIRRGAVGEDPKIAENLRRLKHSYEHCHALAVKYGITEEDVNNAIMEVREEERSQNRRPRLRTDY